ncbi:MAG: catalase, partial [Rhodospirillaceae bacterium]|nr:catalase [Rhodospirillaceae bacterium]
MAKKSKPGSNIDGAGSVLSTVSGPSGSAPPAELGGPGALEAELLRKVAGGQQLAAQRPFNADKAFEYGAAARTPHQGTSAASAEPLATASTAAEHNVSEKVGDFPAIGANRTITPLDRVRADASAQVLTTNQGVPVADNQNSLKVGLRGPTTLEDFILREKITHFDHERIPERVVHARGSAAHGVFEAYEDLSDITCAAPFQEAGKITPVFV